MADRPSVGWPDGSEFWKLGGKPAVISGMAAALMGDDGSWNFVTPSGIRAEGERIDAAAFDDLVKSCESKAR